MRRGRAMLAAMSALAIAGCTQEVTFAGSPPPEVHPENARARAMADLDQAQYGYVPSSQCGPRSPVFVGGTTYCVGTHQ